MSIFMDFQNCLAQVGILGFKIIPIDISEPPNIDQELLFWTHSSILLLLLFMFSVEYVKI